MLVAAAYSSGHEHPVVNQLLAGVACGATGLLTAITAKLGGKLFRQVTSLLIIIATFCLMSFAKLSLVSVLLIMAPIALFIYRPRC
jgi:chromate transporter